MIKNLAEVEVKQDEKVCRFIFEDGANINFLKEALFQFQKYIGALEDAHKAKQAEQQQEIEPPEAECQTNCQESSAS